MFQGLTSMSGTWRSDQGTSLNLTKASRIFVELDGAIRLEDKISRRRCRKWQNVTMNWIFFKFSEMKILSNSWCHFSWLYGCNIQTTHNIVYILVSFSHLCCCLPFILPTLRSCGETISARFSFIWYKNVQHSMMLKKRKKLEKFRKTYWHRSEEEYGKLPRAKELWKIEYDD